MPRLGFPTIRFFFQFFSVFDFVVGERVENRSHFGFVASACRIRIKLVAFYLGLYRMVENLITSLFIKNFSQFSFMV